MAGEDRYRLAPVRDVRARAERVRRGELAAAVDDARASETRVATARARVEAARHAVGEAVAARASLATASQLALADRCIARHRRALADAIADELRITAAHDDQLGEVELARATLARARADKEIIERHFARWREARSKLAERRED